MTATSPDASASHAARSVGDGSTATGREHRRGRGDGRHLLLDSGKLSHARNQGLELQAGEDVADSLGIHRLNFEVGDGQRQFDIGQQTVERAVAAYGVDVLTQVVADDTRDAVSALQQGVERTELCQPLHRGLFTDLRHTGEVVTRLADERGDIGVLLGAHSVPFDHRLGVVALELGDTLHVRVEQRDVVGDELNRVAVARAHEHVETLSGALRGERGEDVVGLEVGLLQHLNAHRREAVLQERDLTFELGRRFGTVGLVLGILARAEGLARGVESDRQVRGFLGLDEVDQHGEKAVDAVRVLAVFRREVVDGESEECPVCQRMAVDDEKGRLCGVRHSDTLVSASDTPSRAIEGAPHE